MLLKHERYYGVGMDALVTACSRNTNVIVVCAWMHWQEYGLGAQRRGKKLGKNTPNTKSKPKSPGASCACDQLPYRDS